MWNAPDISWVRSDENIFLRMPLVLSCVCRNWSNASDVWWKRIPSTSMADLSVTAPNWVGAMTPVSMAAYSVRQAARYSSILSGIESSNIGRHYWGVVRSRFGLGTTTQVASFQLFGM